MKKFNVGIIGLGVGEKHLQTYLKSPLVNKIKAYDWMKACFEWVRKRDTTFTLKIADN